MLKIIKLFLVSLTLFIAFSCANQARRLGVGNIGNLTINDVVHPKLLSLAGIEKRELPEIEMDPQLVDYKREFEADAALYEKPIPSELNDRLRVMQYVDTLSRGNEPGVVATCNRYFLNSKTLGGGTTQTMWTEIEVLRSGADAFAEGDELRLKMLVFHELFHCLYNRGHLLKCSDGSSDCEVVNYGIMSDTLLKSDEMNEEKWEAMKRNMFTTQFELTPLIQR